MNIGTWAVSHLNEGDPGGVYEVLPTGDSAIGVVDLKHVWAERRNLVSAAALMHTAIQDSLELLHKSDSILEKLEPDLDDDSDRKLVHGMRNVFQDLTELLENANLAATIGLSEVQRQVERENASGLRKPKE